MSRSSTRKILTVSALSLALLGAATGCSGINEQATEKVYSASDGVSTNINGMQLRNIMIISSDKGEPGRMIGTVLNPSSTTGSIDFQLSGESISFPIAAEAEVRLEDAEPPQIFPSVPEIPGATLYMPVTVKLGSDTVEQKLYIPILDGTLPEYRPYVPTAVPTAPNGTEESGAPTEEELVTETPSPSPTTTP